MGGRGGGDLRKEEAIGIWPKGTLVSNPGWVCKAVLSPFPDYLRQDCL